MDHYIDHNRNRVVIGRQVGRRGGEGSVFEASSHPGHVVKVYHDAPEESKGAKLWHLSQIANESILKIAAWPKSLVWDGQNRLRGFLMPTVQGKEIHQLYGSKERFIEFPNARWDFLIRVARNCAAAFDEIHSLGVIVGDVNEGNVLVKRDGTVSLIDCDSYQVRHENGFIWTCDVGIALWTAPELQKHHFRGLHRTPNHDLFGLAALIFKLLFMGRHPYAGIPLSSGDFDLEQSIADFKYAFSDRAATYQIKPPPNSLPIGVLPKNYRDLFERAFGRGSERDGARPTAREWVTVLDQLEKNTRSCPSDPTHRFPSHISSCPWCDISDNGGPNFFVTVHVNLQQGNSIAKVWATISQTTELTPTGHDPVRVPLIPCAPSSLPEPDKYLRSEFVWGAIIAVIGVGLLLNGVVLLGLGIIFFGAGLLHGGMHNTSFAALRSRRQTALNEAGQRWKSKVEEIESLEREYKRTFIAKREELRRKYERVTRLDEERKQEIKSLEAKKRQFQLDEFLDRQLLTNAQIQGIGPRKKQTLLAYGVESALDVIHSRRVPGIGDAFHARLMSWRRNCEARFRFNPNQAIPQAEMHSLNVKFAGIRKTLEGELTIGANHLQQINNQAAAKREPLEEQLQEIRKLFSQCKMDLDSVPMD